MIRVMQPQWFILDLANGRPKYMHINLKHFPPETIQWWNLHEKVASDGYVYIKIKKGMYGLKQAAVLECNNLVKNLSLHGCFPCKYSTGLWWHTTNKTKQNLCVDDFGVR